MIYKYYKIRGLTSFIAPEGVGKGVQDTQVSPVLLSDI